MSVTASPTRLVIALVLIASAAVACVDKPTGIEVSPLAGLQRLEGDSAGGPPTDSAAGPPPDSASSPAPNPSAPGYVLGTVLGPSAPGAGNDSLNTAPRIAGVVVTAHPRVAPSAGDSIGVGSAVATVTTGADGKFQLPTLPGGEYIVTFVPPPNSGYGGVWVWGPINDRSHAWPWWVVLWKK
jgi:hypothetical protein